MADITIQPTTKDTQDWECQPDINYGGNYRATPYGYIPFRRNTYWEFDISSIPAGAVISLAKIKLYCSYLTAGKSYRARRITGAWVENTETWNNEPAVTETDGVDLNGPAALGWYEITITNMVATARGLGTILGIRISDITNTSGANDFYTKEYDDDITKRPKLEISYSIPSGPTKLKTFNGLASAKIKTINGLEIAKVKTINGLV
jgi:hypothetical protein